MLCGGQTGIAWGSDRRCMGLPYVLPRALPSAVLGSVSCRHCAVLPRGEARLSGPSHGSPRAVLGGPGTASASPGAGTGSSRMFGAPLGFVRGSPKCCPGALIHCVGLWQALHWLPKVLHGVLAAQVQGLSWCYSGLSQAPLGTRRRCLGLPKVFLCYLPSGLTLVWWCPAVGTGLANVFRGILSPDILCPPLRTSVVGCAV